jgi:hypothetical protein
MSNLRHLTVSELRQEIVSMDTKITYYTNKITGAKTRKEWAEKYLYQKTPQAMTLEQIEQKLGHKVLLELPQQDTTQAA